MILLWLYLTENNCSYVIKPNKENSLSLEKNDLQADCLTQTELVSYLNIYNLSNVQYYSQTSLVRVTGGWFDFLPTVRNRSMDHEDL